MTKVLYIVITAGIALLIVWKYDAIVRLFSNKHPEFEAATIILHFPGIHSVTVVEREGSRHLEAVTKDAVDDPAVYSKTLCDRLRDTKFREVLIRVNRETDGRNLWTGFCRN